MAKKIMSNRILLVISIIVAIIIWMYVIVAEDPVTTTKLAPLPIQHMSSVPMQQKDIELIGELNEKVELVVKGSRSYVTGSKANYSALIDLSQISERGYYTVPVTVKSPAAVSILSQTPTSVDILVDRWESAEKEVIVSRSGSPKAGYGVTQVSEVPQTVTVEAPSLILEQIAYLGLSLNLDGADKTFTVSAVLEAYDENGNKLSMEHIRLPQSAYTVEIGIGKVKTVTVTPTVTGINTAYYDMEFTAEPESVVVTAEDSILSALDDISTHTINLPDRAGSHSVNALLDLPAGVYLADSQPDTIHFKIHITEKDYSDGY